MQSGSKTVCFPTVCSLAKKEIENNNFSHLASKFMYGKTLVPDCNTPAYRKVNKITNQKLLSITVELAYIRQNNPCFEKQTKK